MDSKPLETETLFSDYKDAFTKMTDRDNKNYSESLEKDMQRANLDHRILRTSLTQRAYDHVVHIVVFSLVVYGLIIFFDMFTPFASIDDTKFISISGAVIVEIIGLLLVIVKGLFK